MTNSLTSCMLCGVAFASAAAPAQPTDLPAIPEMARLAKVFAGDWNTVEIVQHGKPIPDGAGRHGTVYVKLTRSGTALVSEGHSVGTVGGELQWFITIWWDSGAKWYRFLSCFRTQLMQVASCEALRTGMATRS